MAGSGCTRGPSVGAMQRTADPRCHPAVGMSPGIVETVEKICEKAAQAVGAIER